MIVRRNIGILEKHTKYSTALGNCSCIALLPAIHGSIWSFWKNISGHFVRFTCNHSLCTGSTVVGQCMEQLSNGYAFRRIEQTTATDGESVDFAGASHRPDSLIFPQNSAFL